MSPGLDFGSGRVWEFAQKRDEQDYKSEIVSHWDQI